MKISRLDNKTIQLYYVDIKGEFVERTPEQYKYSYDPYCIFIDGYKETDDGTYSDRMYEWDSDKFNKCCAEIWNNHGQYFNNRKPKEIEKFLSLYFGRNIKLTGIEQGCNVATGYPYWIFYYRN